MSIYLFTFSLIGLHLTSRATLAQSAADSGPTSCGGQTLTTLSIGERCDDVIYVGATDSEEVYAEAAARDEMLTLEAARTTCARLGAEWRIPTRRELKLLSDGRDTPPLASALDEAWYWSSSSVAGMTTRWVRHVETGQEGAASPGNRFAVRCVRSVGRSPLANDRF